MKTKNIVLFIFVFILGIIQCDAQLGAYYKSTLNKYQKSIVRTGDDVIVIDNKDGLTWMYFTQGFCSKIFIYIKDVSEQELRESLDNDNDYTKSSKGDWWYYTVEASDGNSYHTIVEIWKDEEGIPHFYAYLNEKIE